MSTLTSGEMVARLRWRYAVQRFDPARRIADDAWDALVQSLVLAPSSYGLQPWRFVDVRDPAVRAELRAASWNQPQVTDASHYVVLAIRTSLSEADVDRHVARVAEVRATPVASLAKYRAAMVRDVVERMPAARRDDWCARQTYIALGQFMTAAAAIGVDTCPMEGLDPARYDAILGLAAEGFHTVCACAAGHRAADDRGASLPKVRFATEDVVRRV